LYDLESDPNELNNLAGNKELEDLEHSFADEINSRWDSQELRKDVILDQKRRRKVFESLSKGGHTSWDHNYSRDASKQYMRNHLDLNDLEHETRYPPPCVRTANH
jgi:choline-sulfatase|tara:strand:+ start:103 stop:417 length:315 start_codon:yes stop_codon:yes gene_type:complete